MGKVIAFGDFLRGIPQVIFDPHGPLVDNFLHSVAVLPKNFRRHLWRRILYIDMAGALDRVVAFPLHFELGAESRRDISDRFLTVLRKLDPHLQSASIQGWNPLYRVGAPTGIVLASLGSQIDDAADVLNAPENWDRRFNEAIGRYPECAPAVRFFRTEYEPLQPADRLRLTTSYLGKIAPLTLDVGMQRMFTSSPPTLDLRRAVASGTTVLLDFRHETNPERRRFKTRWLFEYVMAFVKHRGAGRHTPLGLIIDELTELTNQMSLTQDLFSADLDELINVYARNYSLWLCLAHQELFQVSERTRKTLLTMGTQIIGVTADMESARELAYQFAPLDPYRVKRWENVWGSDKFGDYIREQRPVDFPLEEQILLCAQRLAALQPFQFLVKRRSSTRMYAISSRSLIDGAWATDQAVALQYVRNQLTLRTGQPTVIATSLPAINQQPVDLFDTIQDNDDDVFYDEISN